MESREHIEIEISQPDCLQKGKEPKNNLVMDHQILPTVYVLYKIQKEHTLREGQPSFHNLIRDLTKNLDGQQLAEAPTYICIEIKINPQFINSH